MEMNIDFLSSLGAFEWFSLAVILVLIEIFAPTTFILGPALAALLVGAVLSFMPELAWEYQWLTFAVASLIFTAIARKYLNKTKGSDTDNADRLNQRTKELIGHKMTLKDDLVDGHGQIPVGDTVWTAQSEDGVTIAKGSKIEVTAVKGATLVVTVKKS